jgi:hypothetical protein
MILWQLIIFNNITVTTLIYRSIYFISYDLHVTDTFFILNLNNIYKNVYLITENKYNSRNT